MNLLNVGISRISAVILLCAMFCFALVAQALTAPAASAPSFDHSKTGFLLKDVHFTLKCEQCHVDGIFKNTPKDCSGCHSTGTRVAATPKPVSHIPTTAACDTCHVSAATFLVKSFRHDGITSNCSTCHNGQFLGVLSKPANHFPTQLPCENCHNNTSTFLSFRMDHNGVTSGCNACHGGPPGYATPSVTFPNTVGYNAAIHVPLAAYGAIPPDCSVCHIGTTTFLGARFDHYGIATGSCVTCHNSQYPYVVSINVATHIGGLPAAACDTCHVGFANFLGAVFTHTVGSACSTCHTGSKAGIVSITSIHIPSSTNCADCHTDPATVAGTPTFLGVLYHTTALGSPPATPSMTCGLGSSCHNGNYASQNATGKGTTHIATGTADCGSCHTAGYTSFLGATFSHASVTAGSCGTCHQGQYSNVVSINPALHIPQSSGNACDQCHTNALTGFPGSLTPTFNNAVYHLNAPGGIPTGTCSSCHNGAYLTAANGNYPQGKNIGHVLTAGDCVLCHTGPNGTNNTVNYTTFLSASFSHLGTYGSFPADNSTASPKCGSCHGSSATGKVAGHVTTSADCNSTGCHTSYSPNTTGCPNCLTFSGVQWNHINASTGYTGFTLTGPTGSAKRCDSCHNGSTLLAQPVSTGHIATGGADCVACHTPTSTGCISSGLCSTFLNATFNHSTIAVLAGSCGTCHQGQATGVVSINTQVHIPQTSGNVCDTCHTNAITGLTTPSTPTPTFLNVLFHKNALGNPPAATCTSCHSGTYISQNAQAKSTGHLVTAADCGTCHTGPNGTNNTSGYTTFLGATFLHTGTYATFPTQAPATPLCGSCHGVTATGKNAGHISTGSDCIACHTNASTGCPNCTTFLGASAAAPHTPAYMAGKSCSTCHDGSQATGLSAYPTHIAVTGSTGCDQCHPAYDGKTSLDFGTSASVTVSGVGGLVKYGMNHVGLTGRCDSCHNGSFMGGMYGALAKPSNHIPTTITGTLDCTTCHTTLTGAAIKVSSGSGDWLKEVMNHNGNQTAATCVTCHESKKGSYLGSFQTNSGHHTTTCNVKGCHTSSYSYTKW